MIRAAALVCVLAAGASAAPAVPPSSFVYETDPRVELLGVVQYLAGAREKSVPLPAQYGRDLEKHFARFRGHEAVKLYRELAGKYQDFGVDVLFLSAPLELRPNSPSPPPFGGGAADFERFLAALRRFGEESDFVGFYADQAAAYIEFMTSARAEAGARDFPKLVEDYTGRGLESRVHYILSPSFAPRRGVSYIIPYPDPEHGAGVRGPYDVYVLLTPEGSANKPSFVGAYRGMLLDELIYVFVERTFFPYAKEHDREMNALFAALPGACRDRDCLKDLIVRAIGLRLRAAACAPGANCGERRRRKTDAAIELFAGRLAEYEGARDRYPALDAFYPRLLAPPESARSASSSETVPKPKTTSGGHGTPDARSQ